VEDIYDHSRQTPESQVGSDTLKIFTLGRFQVSYGERQLFDEIGRSQKVGELLMYLITNRGKHIPPETILETIWPDHEYSNPKNALKNLVYRLKQGLEKIGVPQAKSLISSSYGGYCWNKSLPYWLDAELFETLCQDARSLSTIDPFRAADKYRDALTLYHGHYLPECQHCNWVLPKRHYYRRLFVRSVSELFAIQKEHRLFAQMAEDCERALSVEDFDESINLFYMEALLEEGKTAQARAHYEYITSLNYYESGARPTPAMQRIYRTIKASTEKAELDFNALRQMLTEKDDAKGALCCEPETFRLFCRLERRRAERENRRIQLGFLSLNGTSGSTETPGRELKEAMECLRTVLVLTLRKADMFSPWNDTQFTVLLPGLTRTEAENLLQRIREAFKGNSSSDLVALRSSVHSFQSQDESILE